MKTIGVASLVVVAFLAVAVFCAGCVSPTTTSPSPNATMPSTSPTALGAGITVMQGQNFTIQLQSNPSTGFTWKPIYDNSSIMFVNRVYIASSVSPGAPGADIFTFQGTKPGTSIITFNYTNSSNQTTSSVNYTITCTTSNVTQGNAALVSQGQNFTIRLQSNPSSGSDWQPTFDNSSITLVNRAFAGGVSTSSATVAGAAGTDLFTFQAVKQGTSVITFNNANATTNQTMNSTTYTVVITP
ncbi:MAG: protease inhibitor I42 family protein [Halobacteriota archaeon]